VDSQINERLRCVADRVRVQKGQDGRTSSKSLEKRQARARILAELPRLLTRVTACVSEINERLEDDRVWLTVSVADRTPTTEAVLTVRVEDEDSGPELVFNVNYTGTLTVLLVKHLDRSLIKTSDVFQANMPFLLDLLLLLLETTFPASQGA
jgi:hypothetical protein